MHKTIQVLLWLLFGVALTISKGKSLRRRLSTLLNDLESKPLKLSTWSWLIALLLTIDCPVSKECTERHAFLGCYTNHRLPRSNFAQNHRLPIWLRFYRYIDQAAAEICSRAVAYLSSLHSLCNQRPFALGCLLPLSGALFETDRFSRRELFAGCSVQDRVGKSGQLFLFERKIETFHPKYIIPL